jgi:hypothetical protein
MINVHQFINGLLVGSAMIALGLFPRLLQMLTEAVIVFTHLAIFGFTIPRTSITAYQQRRWFAAIGAALIILTFAAYFTHA